MLEYADLIEVEVPQDDSASIGEKMFLYGLIRATKPKVVLETGTHRGKATLYMLHALWDNAKENAEQGGHLYTCDPNEDWGARGNFAKFKELNELVTYNKIRGADWDIDENIDVFFCDGFHGVTDVLEEIEHFFPKLNDRALVVFHDCDESEENEREGVNMALKVKNIPFVHIMSQNRMRIYEHRKNISDNAINTTKRLRGRPRKSA